VNRRFVTVFDWLLGVLPWLAGVLVIAGLVHISSILAMPRLAPDDAYMRIAAAAPLHQVSLLQATAPGERATPFEDPALAQGLCRYDLSQGPLRLRATLAPDALMLFSFHARFGQVYYSMTDRSATRGKLEMLLLTPGQLESVEAQDSEDELPQELRLVAPTLQGFLLFRALAERPGDYVEAQKRIAAISCGLDRDTRS
jgi:uncharacterized membrane protein